MVLPVALLAVTLLVSVGLVARWGSAAVASSRAQAAADAAALVTLVSADPAALANGLPVDDVEAEQAARAGGGKLVAFDVRVDDGMARVEVVVEVGGQRAAAAAEVLLPPTNAGVPPPPVAAVG